MEGSEIIKLFCEKTGIGFEPDADGSLAFEADGLRVTISELHELDAIALVGDLGEPPPERLETLYKIMLEANHLFGGTAGATLSLDHETGRFVLCRVLQCKAIDDDLFYAEAERFVSSLEAWAKVIGDFRDSSPSGNQENETSSDVSGFIAV
jgi:hypothetical protein